MALALRHRIDRDRNAAERIESNRRGGLCATFRAGFLPLLRAEHGRDVAHVGDRRLDHRGKADAVKPAFSSRQVAPASQFGEPAPCGGDIDGGAIVARVEDGARRTAIRKCLDEIAPDHLQRIEVENHADALHQPLERKIHLRPAEAAI